MFDRIVRAAGLLSFVALLGACASDPVPQGTPGNYKVGAPYQIGGTWYYPEENTQYDETGIASWYGPGFAGRKTANGEIFDPRLVTAAHKTLPMPVNVRITNLENGRSIVARVNDRGPFKPSRIIDVSEEGAKLLGFKAKGMTRVRVQFLEVAVLPEGRPGKRIAGKGIHADIDIQRPPSSKPVASAPPVVAAPPPPPSGDVPVPIASPLDEPDGSVTKVPVANKGQIYVQAGAFLDRANAETLVAALRPIGEFRISTKTQGNQMYYRVRFGPITRVNDADSVLDRVLMAGHNGAQIIVE